MNELAEQIFAGVWKSFKVFKATGGIRLCTVKQFTELNFRQDASVDVIEHRGDHIDSLAKSAPWQLELKNNKHFLHIPSGKLTYEVITVNHYVMVLLHPISGEKIFFARERDWREHINSNKAVIL